MGQVVIVGKCLDFLSNNHKLHTRFVESSKAPLGVSLDGRRC